MMEFFYGITEDDFFTNTETFVENCVPYIEVDKSKNSNAVVTALLSGIAILSVDGLDEIILIDAEVILKEKLLNLKMIRFFVAVWMLLQKYLYKTAY